MSATLTAIVIGAGVGALNQGVTGRAAASTDPATLKALRYLQAQAGADGSLASSAGATEDGVIGFADNGYDPATLHSSGHPSAIDYLTAATQSGTATTDTAGHTAKLILAVKAAHLDPTAFGGKNLVTILTGYYSSTTGVYASASEMPNVESQSFSILALSAASQTVPPAALDLLVCARRSDGAYGYVITAAATVTSPNCADTSGGDTNSTSIAVEALAAGGRPVDASTPTYLHSAQQSDAGFGFDASGPSDPDSDATVIQALVAAGQDPAAASWTKAGHTPVSNLLTFQDPGGGFTFPGSAGPDAFTTSEVPAAMAGKPYGAATSFAPGATVATPSPTPTPTVTATAAASARPSPTPTASAVAAVGPPNTGGGDAELPAVPAAAGALAALGAAAAAILWRRRRHPQES